VGGVKSYVAIPSKSNGQGICYIPDAFGLEFINNKLLADDFARAGFTTVIPDIFNGSPVPSDVFDPGYKGEKFDLMAWVGKQKPENVDKMVEDCIEGMKSEYGVKKIGAVGYCFGGRYVVRFLKDGRIDAGFGAHISLVEDSEIEAVKGPLSLACAETDNVFGTEKRHTAEGLLAKTGAPYELRLFGATQHGFAVRCDLKDPKQKYAKEAAFNQAVVWFNEWLQ